MGKKTLNRGSGTYTISFASNETDRKVLAEVCRREHDSTMVGVIRRALRYYVQAHHPDLAKEYK